MSVFLFGSGGSSDMKLIFSTTLTSDTATISTGTLLTGFKHLIIYISLRSDRSANTDDALIAFNNDTANASYQYIRTFNRSNGLGSEVNFSSLERLVCLVPATNTGTDNAFGGGSIRLINHESTTNYKNYIVDHSEHCKAGTNSANFTDRIGGQWRNTDAITSVTLSLNNGGFKAGSSLNVYGLK